MSAAISHHVLWSCQHKWPEALCSCQWPLVTLHPDKVVEGEIREGLGQGAGRTKGSLGAGGGGTQKQQCMPRSFFLVWIHPQESPWT